MAKTRTRAAGKAGSTIKRRAVPRRKKRNVPSRRFWATLLLSISFAGLLVFVPVLSFVPDLYRGFLELFGAGVMIVFLLLGALGLFVAMGHRSLPWLRPKTLFVAFLSIIFVFGLLAFVRPVGPEPLDEFTAGGKLGLTVVGAADFWGGTRLVLLFLLGVVIVAPRWSMRRARDTGPVLVHAGRTVGRVRHVRLPRRPRRTKIASSDHIEQMPDAVEATGLQEKKQKTEKLPRAKEDHVEIPPAVSVEASEAPKSNRPPDFRLPPIDILDPPVVQEATKVDDVQRAKLIEEKLAEYGVDAKVVEIKAGPTITQFGVEPGWDVKTREVRERDEEGRIVYDKLGNPKVRTEEVSRTRVKVNRITRLSNDLALALAAPTIRIEAPIPGRPMVGIEVPNAAMVQVSLRAVIESPSFQKLKDRSHLALALGQRADQFVVADLAKMPHLLIAGATGSGKSVCMNSIVTALLMYATPQEVRLLMVDPKRVELSSFDGVPHLLAPVVVDVEKVVGVLQWVTHEMDTRYQKFAAASARNIDSYNKKVSQIEQLPYLVVVIDELADLMMVAAVEVERLICRLAQLARATGIHLIVATQRPSVDVITGLIKANFPTRIAFAVTSQVDSRTILDTGGAEKLLGRGDMLFMPTDAAKPLRLQGTYVNDAEIERLVAHWRKVAAPEYLLDIQKVASLEAAAEAEIERRFADAAAFAVRYRRVSESSLRRGLGIGKDLAVGLVRRLQEDSIIGPADGSGSHVVIAEMVGGDLDDQGPPWETGPEADDDDLQDQTVRQYSYRK